MKDIIVVRGGGDIATGVIQKLYRSGFKVLILETNKPTCIRRTVSLCEALYTNTVTVEDVTSQKIENLNQLETCYKNNTVPIIIDPEASSIEQIKPLAVIDAILAKKNLGTNKTMAPITISLGPGFLAGEDVDIAIETMRGHNLGRLIFKGETIPNTGIPGEIGGKSAQRVIHAPTSGKISHINKIGDIVEKDQTIFKIDETEIKAPFTGLLRGLIREGLEVKKGLKIADIDPRTDTDYTTISDKARCIGGAALEAYLYLRRKI